MTDNKTMTPAEATAASQGSVPTKETPSIAVTATTMGEWETAIQTTEREASDLVASKVVRDGYLAHGHPAELGFMHMNFMAARRLRKRFPLFTADEPLFRMLLAKGKLIVGRGLVKKYEARLAEKKFDHLKWIDREFEKLFSSMDEYRDALREIDYAGT